MGNNWWFDYYKVTSGKGIKVICQQEIPLGTRYEDGRLVVKQEEIEGDMLIPGDRRTMEIVRDIGNSIHPSIQLEVDWPSNYEDGKMPLLD